MILRPTRYPRVARQGESCGRCLLRYPFAELWRQFRRRFLKASLARLAGQGAVPPIAALLDEARLGPEAVSLEEWFGHYVAPALKPSYAPAALRKLAERAIDLTHDDGQWLRDAAELDEAAAQALAELRQRLPRVTEGLTRDQGPEAALQLLEHLRGQWRAQAEQWEESVPWDTRQNAELQQAAEQLRRFAQPQGVWKLLARVRPVQEARWLTEAQRHTVSKRLLPCIGQALAFRYDQERRKRQRAIPEALLGRPGASGFLDRLTAEVETRRAFFGRLAGDDLSDAVSASGEPDEILLVRDLDTPLDAGGAVTVGTLFMAAVREAGCTPAEFAARLQEHGIRVRGRSYRPGEWAALPPAEVRVALEDGLAAYLGDSDAQAPLDLEQPRSALEHAAAITPLHPAFARRLDVVLPAWVRQSRPYVEVHPLAGAEPQVHVMLYCYPPHRRFWEERLETKATPVTALSSPEAAEEYGMATPYTMELVQYAVAVPLGAVKTLASWRHQGQRLQRDRKHVPQHDPAAYPEQRLLAQRPDDHDDARLLFGAAVSAKLLAVLPGTPERYALQGAGTSLERLFAPPATEAVWQPDTFFLEQLRHEHVLQALELAFARVPGIGAEARRLRQETNAAAVARRLAALEVLEAGASGLHYRLPGAAAGVCFPEGFFREAPGALVGLTEETFIGELHRRDDLYTALFWRVRDALTLGVLSANDVPPFLRDHHGTL